MRAPTERVRFGGIAIAALLVGCLLGASRASSQCVGDCAGDGAVTIDDLILGVNIALGSQPVGACLPFANSQREVKIAQLIQGVNNALDGCAPVSIVVNRLEQAGPLPYRIYLQDEPNGANRKGLVLFGSGNDESDPTTGSLDGNLENNTANELAELGYVAAIVAYRDEPPLVVGDGGESWNSDTAMLATDMSTAANAIISKYGNGLSRDHVVTGGVSYASYALLTNAAENDTPLADTRGVLATCGATDDSTNLQLPVFSLNCSGNPEGGLNGEPLIDQIATPSVQANSGYFTDPACNTHCGGDTNTWTAKLVEQVQHWLP